MILPTDSSEPMVPKIIVAKVVRAHVTSSSGTMKRAVWFRASCGCGARMTAVVTLDLQILAQCVRASCPSCDAALSITVNLPEWART